MSNTNQILGQCALASSTLTDVYVVPSGMQATITTITLSNRGLLSTSFRVSICKNGEADNPKQYIYYDVPLPANDTFMVSGFLLISDGDVVRCRAANASVSINLTGQEDPKPDA